MVGKRARLICEHVEAHGGVECLGILDAKDFVTGGEGLRLGPKAEFKGELHAPAVEMEPGAKVHPSWFAVAQRPPRAAEPRGRPAGAEEPTGNAGGRGGARSGAGVDPVTGKPPPKVARTRGHRPG